MQCNAKVTFEFMTSAPETVEIKDIKATSVGTVAARALKAAKKLKSGKSWSSIVLLIERIK